MPLSPTDTDRIKKYYSESLQAFGPNEAKSLHWEEKTSQLTRFKVLERVGNLNHSSVLDAGSGLGDLYEFLKAKYTDMDYLGLDLVPDMTEAAQKKYPEAKFLNQDILEFKENFDFILSSGMLSFSLKTGKQYYYDVIEHMYKISNKAVAFNVLNSEYVESDEIFFSYSISEISQVCEKLTSNFKIISDYELADFTVYLYKNTNAFSSFKPGLNIFLQGKL